MSFFDPYLTPVRSIIPEDLVTISLVVSEKKDGHEIGVSLEKQYKFIYFYADLHVYYVRIKHSKRNAEQQLERLQRKR